MVEVKPVYLFVNHPYFKYWINLLDLSDCIANCNTENAETPCESKNEGKENVPTYSLPKKQESNIYIASKDNSFKVSTEIIPNEIKDDMDFQNIVNMYALKMYDKVKDGFNIKYLSVINQ